MGAGRESGGGLGGGGGEEEVQEGEEMGGWGEGRGREGGGRWEEGEGRGGSGQGRGDGKETDERERDGGGGGGKKEGEEGEEAGRQPLRKVWDTQDILDGEWSPVNPAPGWICGNCLFLLHWCWMLLMHVSSYLPSQPKAVMRFGFYWLGDPTD